MYRHATNRAETGSVPGFSFVTIFILVIATLLCVSRSASAQCQQVGCDDVPPVVTPTFDPTTIALDTMRITWCDNDWLMPATRTITLNGTNMVGSFSYNSASGGCTVRAVSVGAATLNPGTTYTLFATIEDGHGNIGTGSDEFTTPNGWVVVNPKGLGINRPQQSSNLTQAFVVKNPSPTANNYRLVRTCLGNLSGCTTIPDTVHLSGGDSTTVSVTYNTGLLGSGTSGTIRLRARMTTDTTIADSTDVAITLVSSFIVDDSPNNNDAQNMTLCAYSCFANIYTHSTVPYFSLDQPRGVTLVNNHLRMWAKPYLHFNISDVPGAPAIDGLKLVVKDSATGSDLRIQGDASSDGIVLFTGGTGTRRIGTQIKDDSWLTNHGTGLHPVRVEVTATRAGLVDETVTIYVRLLVVRDPPGAVARGWYVDGVQRLIPESDGRVIVTEADGSAFLFTATGTPGSYQTPAGEFSVLSRADTGVLAIYTRAYPDSSKVRFDYQGRMLDAADSWGKKIRYAYDGSGRPTRIYDPYRTRPDSVAAPSAYTELVYYADSVLIRPPQADGSSFDASRVTRLRLTADSLLRAVVDPDGDSTRFWYGASVMPSPNNNRQVYLDSVYNRSGVRQAYFKYDKSNWEYVGSFTLHYAQGPTIPTYTNNGNTTNSNPSVTLYDWRGRGVPAVATSLWGRWQPVALDTLYSEVRDPGSHSSYGVHDRWGQFTKFITHNKKDTTTVFRSSLFADSIRSPMGMMDRFAYTTVAGGRPALVASYPTGKPSTSYTYGALGQVDSIFTGSTTTHIKRLNNNPAHIDSIITAGYPTKFEYDAWGRLFRTTDPKGHKVEVFFDSTFGNTRKTLYEGTRFNAALFDSYGRESILSSTLAATQFVEYDLLNRVTRDSVSGASGATAYHYDKQFLVRVIDPKGQIFKRETNALGWSRKIYDPADTSKFVIHEYDVEGLPRLFVNRRGQWKEMYNGGDINPHVLDWTNADNNTDFNRADYSYAYRTNGSGKRIGTVVVGTNNYATDSILSDSLGRLEKVITRITANHSSGLNSDVGQKRYVRNYKWNDHGQLLSDSLETRQAGTEALIRTFTPRRYWWNDTTRALDSISLTGVSATAKIKRDVEGKDSTWMFPGYNETVLATKRHEPWVQGYSVPAIDAPLTRYYAYSDTIPGLIKSMIFADSSLMRAFRYSPQGDMSWLSDLLIGGDCASPPGGVEVDGYTCTPTNPTVSRTLGLEYDAARNLRKQVDSVNSVTDTAVVATGNRLTSWGSKSYTFDLDGNMITRTVGGNTTTFKYDGESMLRRTIAGSDTTCYEYNAFNQLVFSGTNCKEYANPGGQAVRKVQRVYVWDRGQLMAEVDSFGSTRFAEYVYRPGVDRPHALLSDSASGTIARFFHQDMLGNVIGVTRGATMAQSLNYEPWGVLTDSSGTLADTSRLRWKGLYWEGGNTKLYYVRNRWYDPEARRFTSEDPIGIDGGMNLYTFAHNDWVNRGDPSGLEPQCYPYWMPPVTVTSFGIPTEYPGYYETRCDDRLGTNIPADPYDAANGFGGLGSPISSALAACARVAGPAVAKFVLDILTVTSGYGVAKTAVTLQWWAIKNAWMRSSLDLIGYMGPSMGRLGREGERIFALRSSFQRGAATMGGLYALDQVATPMIDNRAWDIADLFPFSSTFSDAKAMYAACRP